jgi:hypothetical protein
MGLSVYWTTVAAAPINNYDCFFIKFEYAGEYYAGMPRWVRVEKYRVFPIAGVEMERKTEMLCSTIAHLIRRSIMSADDMQCAYYSPDRSELYVKSTEKGNIFLYKDEIDKLIPLIYVAGAVQGDDERYTDRQIIPMENGHTVVL